MLNAAMAHEQDLAVRKVSEEKDRKKCVREQQNAVSKQAQRKPRKRAPRAQKVYHIAVAHGYAYAVHALSSTHAQRLAARSETGTMATTTRFPQLTLVRS